MYTKKDLVDHLCNANGKEPVYLSRVEAERAVNGVIDGIMALATRAEGEGLNISGFGAFKRSHRAARTGRNPKTGEALQIKASVKVAFRMSKAFKDTLGGCAA